MRWGRTIGAVLALSALTTVVQRETPTQRELADLEFSLKRSASQRDREGVALVLWRTRVIDRVEGDRHFRRVYLRHPGNLPHVELVRRELESIDAVEDVESLTAIISRTASQ